MRDASDRLQPVVVETRRGAEQLMQILETLARVELTDGLTLPQLIGETMSELPRDATVIAILPKATPETAVTLGNLKRQGYAVTAILNLYEEYQFAEAAGPLIAEGIDVQQLRDEASIVSVCRKFILG